MRTLAASSTMSISNDDSGNTDWYPLITWLEALMPLISCSMDDIMMYATAIPTSNALCETCNSPKSINPLILTCSSGYCSIMVLCGFRSAWITWVSNWFSFGKNSFSKRWAISCTRVRRASSSTAWQYWMIEAGEFFRCQWLSEASRWVSRKSLVWLNSYRDIKNILTHIHTVKPF